MELPNLIAYGIIAAGAGLALFIIMKVGQKLLKFAAIVFLLVVGYYFVQGGSATEIRQSLDEAWQSITGAANEVLEKTEDAAEDVVE
ncbi:MAG: hypothetical protein ACFBZ8_08790 [Opitutales bacterium]